MLLTPYRRTAQALLHGIPALRKPFLRRSLRPDALLTTDLPRLTAPESLAWLIAALEAQGFEVNPQLWDGIAAGTATRAQGEAPQFGGGYSVTGTATNTEENKAFYQGLANTWANDYKDAAIVVFAREGGEGHDLLMDDVDTDGSTISSLALHKDERDLLEMVRKDFDKVIVLLNSPYQHWDYSDPETAVLGVAFHSLEWLFVRVAPPLFLAALVGIFFTYKKE